MRILTFLIICLVATTVIARQNFRAEADSFLKTIPDGSQQACASAVLKAINGDTGDLENLRNSRNKETPVPKGVCATNLGNMRLYRPSDAIGSKLPLLVYLHGGGWTIGSINSCAEFCCNLVAEGDMAVLAVDYALAPEHPFPEGAGQLHGSSGISAQTCRRMGHRLRTHINRRRQLGRKPGICNRAENNTVLAAAAAFYSCILPGCKRMERQHPVVERI